MNEIREELNKWRHILRPWIRRLNIVKMSVLPILIYGFNAILVKIPESSFMDTDKQILKFIWRGKRSRQPFPFFLEGEQIGELTIPNFKTSQKATVMKTVWYWQKKNRQLLGQWNRIGSPEMDPLKHCQLIFDKGANVV